MTFKTVAFWEHVSGLYDVNYVVKVDDDSYVRLDRLTIALQQWADRGAGKALPTATPWELWSMLFVPSHKVLHHCTGALTIQGCMQSTSDASSRETMPTTVCG